MPSNSSSQQNFPVAVARPGDVFGLELDPQLLVGVTPGTRLYYRISAESNSNPRASLIGLNSDELTGGGRRGGSSRSPALMGSFEVENSQTILSFLARTADYPLKGSTHQLQLFKDASTSQPLGAPITFVMAQAITTGSTPIQEQIKARGPLQLQPSAEAGAPEDGRLIRLDASTFMVVGARRGELESVSGSAAAPTLFTQVIRGHGDTRQTSNWVVEDRQVVATLDDPSVDYDVNELRNADGSTHWLVSVPRTAWPSERAPAAVADPSSMAPVGRAVIDVYRIDSASAKATPIQTVDLGLPGGFHINLLDAAPNAAGLLTLLQSEAPDGSQFWYLAQLNTSESRPISLQPLQLEAAGALETISLHGGHGEDAYLCWAERSTADPNHVQVFIGQLDGSSGKLLWRQQLAAEQGIQQLSGIDLRVTGAGSEQRLIAAVTLASDHSLSGSQLELSVLDSRGRLLAQRELLESVTAQTSTNILSHPKLVQIPDGRVVLTATAYDASNSILPTEVYGLLNADGSNLNSLELYLALDRIPGFGDYHEQLVPLVGQSNSVAVLSESYDQTNPHLINGLTFEVLELDQLLADKDKYFIPYSGNQPQTQSALLAGTSPASNALGADSRGQPWLTSFAVIGDYGNVFWRRNNISTEKAPVNYVGQAIRSLQPDFIVSLGDDNYVEGTREWKDFNVGKNFAPYIYPYTLSKVNLIDDDARAIASPSYLADQVARVSWNRFYPAPGNHDVGMSGGKGNMEASGRRDWSYDNYYKAALEDAKAKGAVIPIASSYVKKGDTLYWDYSYDTGWNMSTWGKYKEGAMDPSYYDYIAHPVDKNGKVLNTLANLYMVDRNNTAGGKGYAYGKWKDKNPNESLDPQAKAIMAEANKRRNDVPWQIFASHYQTFTSENVTASNPGGMDQLMNLPYFSNGFDLVLGAHVHNYERFLNKDSEGKEGIYVVNGTGGYNTVYTSLDLGADEVFAPIGRATGYQAGWTGGFGFGWIEMNANELKYTQKHAQFTSSKRPQFAAVRDYLEGLVDLNQVKMIDLDSFVLRKKSAGLVGSTSLIQAASGSVDGGAMQLDGDDVERIDIITNARLDRGDIYLETYVGGSASSNGKGANVRIEAENPSNAIHLSGHGDAIDARYAGIIIDAPYNNLDRSGADLISLSAALPNGASTAAAIAIDQSTVIRVADKSGTLLSTTIAALAAGLGPAVFHNVVNAGGGNNAITGSARHDFILAGAGKDVISAVGGVDLIAPGGGADAIDSTGAQVTLRIDVGDLDGSVKTISGWDSNDRVALSQGIHASGFGSDRLLLRSSSPGAIETVLQLSEGRWTEQQVVRANAQHMWLAAEHTDPPLWIKAAGGETLRIDFNSDSGSRLSFVRLEDASGQIKDPISGQRFKPGDPGYASVALLPSSQLAAEQLPFLNGESWLSPLVTRADGSRVWSIPALNTKGQSLFKILGAGQFGVELGVGDQVDHGDLIASIM